MTTEFLGSDIWTEITAVAKASQKPCLAAVAYFAKGASSRLPLPKGSRLVVNASESNVKSGATCPADLLKLLNHDVLIFNEPRLHAKVFVFGKTAYVGSTNVSKTSAEDRIEAALRTTDSSAVHAARAFIDEHCLQELGPERLKELQTIYREPKYPGGARKRKALVSRVKGPTVPRVFLVQLSRIDLTEEQEALRDSGQAKAKRRRIHPRIWTLNNFQWERRSHFEKDDIVIQVVHEGKGKYLIDAPGNILHIETSNGELRPKNHCIFLELPKRRRRSLASLAKKLQCTQKALRHDGMVRDRLFAQRLVRELSGVNF
jgi:hypothetical protein